jgi:2-dehydropantoate 2-reductase
MALAHSINTVRWTVVGQGAIGLLAAARLFQAGYQVQLHRRLAADFSFCLQSAGQSTEITLPSPLLPPYQFILLPVKAYAVVDAVRQLLPLLAADAQLVLSHNGMGTIEQVLPLLQPSQGLWFLSTSHGAYKNTENSVIHSGLGQSMLGALNQPALTQKTNIENAMQAALGPVQLLDNITAALWQKLAVNAVINPLTALHQCKNGELSQPQYAAAIRLLIEEFVAVARLCGQDFTIEQIQKMVMQVIQQTADNYSSMQQDYAKGRTSELDYITGFILKQAAQHQLSLPAHQAIYQLLLQKLPR